MALLLWSFARMGIVHPTIYFRLSEEVYPTTHSLPQSLDLVVTTGCEAVGY